MMSSILKRAAPAVLALLLAAPALAQPGSLDGAVTDDKGKALPGVSVTLTGLGAPIVGVTNDEGQFSFFGLEPGYYQLQAERDGFFTAEVNIPIAQGRTTTAAVPLKPNPAARFVDNRDGTVRDVWTGLIWLKDASCKDLEAAGWDQAKGQVAVLASGTCGLEDRSAAGAWRLPKIKDFCKAWSGERLSPCPSTAASDSLIDSSLGGAPFVPGDAFVGVLSEGYWSATEADAGHAWHVDLRSGSVGAGLKSTHNYAWPVRGGQ